MLVSSEPRNPEFQADNIKLRELHVATRESYLPLGMLVADIEEQIVCLCISKGGCRDIVSLTCVSKSWRMYTQRNLVRTYAARVKALMDSTLIVSRPIFRVCLRYHHQFQSHNATNENMTGCCINQYLCGTCLRQNTHRQIGTACYACERRQCIADNARGKRCKKKMHGNTRKCVWHM